MRTLQPVQESLQVQVGRLQVVGGSLLAVGGSRLPGEGMLGSPLPEEGRLQAVGDRHLAVGGKLQAVEGILPVGGIRGNSWSTTENRQRVQSFSHTVISQHRKHDANILQ